MSEASFTRRSALFGVTAGIATLPFAGDDAFAANTGPKVYLDPGHGGRDSGAVGNGMQEKWLTLRIARIARDNLRADNFRVRMSRNSDVYRSLSERVQDANSWGASVFVSIHINAGGGTGFESYRSPNAPSRTTRFQNRMHERVLTRMRNSGNSIRDRGKKTALFYVLRYTNMSAVLTENLFIDNSYDASLLKRDRFIQRIGIGHANGVRRFFDG